MTEISSLELSFSNIYDQRTKEEEEFFASLFHSNGSNDAANLSTDFSIPDLSGVLFSPPQPQQTHQENFEVHSPSSSTHSTSSSSPTSPGCNSSSEEAPSPPVKNELHAPATSLQGLFTSSTSTLLSLPASSSAPSVLIPATNTAPFTFASPTKMIVPNNKKTTYQARNSSNKKDKVASSPSSAASTPASAEDKKKRKRGGDDSKEGDGLAMAQRLGLTKEQYLTFDADDLTNFVSGKDLSTELTKDYKKLRRIILNRKYAVNTREKKRQKVSALEEQVNVLGDRVHELERINAELQQKLASLSQQSSPPLTTPVGTQSQTYQRHHHQPGDLGGRDIESPGNIPMNERKAGGFWSLLPSVDVHQVASGAALLVVLFSFSIYFQGMGVSSPPADKKHGRNLSGIDHDSSRWGFSSLWTALFVFLVLPLTCILIIQFIFSSNRRAAVRNQKQHHLASIKTS